MTDPKLLIVDEDIDFGNAVHRIAIENRFESITSIRLDDVDPLLNVFRPDFAIIDVGRNQTFSAHPKDFFSEGPTLQVCYDHAFAEYRRGCGCDQIRRR